MTAVLGSPNAVSFAETAALGALAGFTIFLSLPFGRLTSLSARARVALAMFAVGVLAFLFVDVLEHAFGIVEDGVEQYEDGHRLARPCDLADAAARRRLRARQRRARRVRAAREAPGVRGRRWPAERPTSPSAGVVVPAAARG